MPMPIVDQQSAEIYPQNERTFIKPNQFEIRARQQQQQKAN